MSFVRSWIEAFLVRLRRYFFQPAELRAYACLRIGYAIGVWFALLDVWPLRLVLLSDSGFFGRAPDAVGKSLNLFYWFHSSSQVTNLHLFVGLAIICLALGIYTRLAALVVHIWFLSMSEQALPGMGGFDLVFRVIGFVLVISPEVRTWSLLSKWKNQPVRPAPVYGLRLVQWQLFLIYIGTVWLKAPDKSWREGEVIPYFLVSMFSRFPDPMFADFTRLGVLLTWGTLVIEASLPFLLWSRKWRFTGVFLGCSLHLFIALTAKLTLFALAMLPLYFAFFERRDFERLNQALQPWLGAAKK